MDENDLMKFNTDKELSPATSDLMEEKSPIDILSYRKNRRTKRKEAMAKEFFASPARYLSQKGLRLCLILQELAIMMLCFGGVIAVQCVLDIILVTEIFPEDIYYPIYDSISGCAFIPFFGVLAPVLLMGSLQSVRRAKAGLDFYVSDIFYYFRKGNAIARRRISLISLVSVVVMTLPSMLLYIGISSVFSGLKNIGAGWFAYFMLISIAASGFAFFLVFDFFMVASLLPIAHLVAENPYQPIKRLRRASFGVIREVPREVFSLTAGWTAKAVLSALPVGVPFVIFFYPSVMAAYDERCSQLVKKAVESKLARGE